MENENNDKLFDENKKEIAPVEAKDIAKQAIAPGTEAISKEDTTFPRFKLLQNTSGEVENEEAKAGLIKNSLTEECVDKIEVIPLTLIKSRVMFNPEDRKGAPICRGNDKEGSGCSCGCENICGKCTYQKWDKGVPPICSLVYNYPCLTPGQIGKEALPALLSFMKSSTDSALKINTSIKYSSPPAPFWTYVWEISSSPKKFKRGTAYIYSVKKIRETTSEERKWAHNVYSHCVAGKNIDVEVDDSTE